MKCEICNKDILDNSQYINGKYYHNDCIEQIQQENSRLKDKIEKATNFVDKYMDEWDFQDEVRKDMNDLLILLKEN